MDNHIFQNPFLKFSRIPEPELMEDIEQVKAYANANFSESHSMIIQYLKDQLPSRFSPFNILDLGAGPGDMTARLHQLYPLSRIDALDASAEMQKTNQHYFAIKYPNAKMNWIHALLQNFRPEKYYDLIFSNSLLHHLSDAFEFWAAIQRSSDENSFVFICDLIRPATFKEVEYLVTKYTVSEDSILQKDFYNSLLAAYTLEEVRNMLQILRLENKLRLEQISDRHWVCFSKNKI